MNMEMKYTLPQRIERARALRAEGHNCAQCVVMAFDDISSPSAMEAVNLAAKGFGSGIGARGMVCGAVSGMTMVLGMADSSPRPQLYKRVGSLIDTFTALEGSCICADLKKPGRKPCIDLITDAVEMLHRNLEAADAQA